MLSKMLVKRVVNCTDIVSTSAQDDAPAALMPRTRSAAATSLRLRRAPRITCSNVDATIFATVDSLLATSVQDACKTPTSVAGLDRTNDTLTSENKEHESLMLLCSRGESSLAPFRNNLEEDEHYTRVIEGDAYNGDVQDASQLGAASCLPHSEMSCHEEKLDCPAFDVFKYSPLNYDDGSTSFHNSQAVSWDAGRDNETLRYFYRNRRNLVLDSITPDKTPHIVITPVEETWEGQYALWQNRIDMQWPPSLCVPQLDMSRCRLPEPYTFPDSQVDQADCTALPLEIIPVPAVACISALRVFSPSKFRESLVVTQVIRTLQRQKCADVFFSACAVAQVFRERYDVSANIVAVCEPAFRWTDPAEPVLAANRIQFGTTILDSDCPFLVPHIVINAPPPQDPMFTESNLTSTQDHGYGQVLVVPSRMADVINTFEDWDDASSLYYNSLVHCDTVTNVEETDVDLSESPLHSRPGTPLPETPVDEDDDLEFFYMWHGDDDRDNGMETSAAFPRILGFESGPADDLCPDSDALSSMTRPMFYIDEDDDDLPSLDDW